MIRPEASGRPNRLITRPDWFSAITRVPESANRIAAPATAPQATISSQTAHVIDVHPLLPVGPSPSVGRRAARWKVHPALHGGGKESGLFLHPDGNKRQTINV